MISKGHHAYSNMSEAYPARKKRKKRQKLTPMLEAAQQTLLTPSSSCHSRYLAVLHVDLTESPNLCTSDWRCVCVVGDCAARLGLGSGEGIMQQMCGGAQGAYTSRRVVNKRPKFRQPRRFYHHMNTRLPTGRPD